VALADAQHEGFMGVQNNEHVVVLDDFLAQRVVNLDVGFKKHWVDYKFETEPFAVLFAEIVDVLIDEHFGVVQHDD
jgi:hypothetical protein